VKLAFALSHRAGLNANGVPSFSPGLPASATLGTPPARLQTRVARATGPYRPATRRTERVRRSVCLRRPFPIVRPAPLSRAGSPAGRASDPCHPCRVHAFAIRALERIFHSEVGQNHAYPCSAGFPACCWQAELRLAGFQTCVPRLFNHTFERVCAPLFIGFFATLSQMGYEISGLERPWPSSTCFPYPLPPGQTPITKNSKKYYIAPQEVAKNALAANNPFFRNPARLRLQ